MTNINTELQEVMNVLRRLKVSVAEASDPD